MWTGYIHLGKQRRLIVGVSVVLWSGSYVFANLLNLLYYIIRRARIYMKKIIQLTKEQLIDLYINKNYTVNKIALELHVGSATVNRKLKEFNIKKSEDQRRAAISAAKRQKTDDEKAEYAKHVSLARKGKGKGVAPWNKGKHTGNG